MNDLTAAVRILAAERVVREQRVDHVGTEAVIFSGAEASIVGLDDYVDADDYREVVSELARLQRAVMGEPDGS